MEPNRRAGGPRSPRPGDKPFTLRESAGRGSECASQRSERRSEPTTPPTRRLDAFGCRSSGTEGNRPPESGETTDQGKTVGGRVSFLADFKTGNHTRRRPRMETHHLRIFRRRKHPRRNNFTDRRHADDMQWHTAALTYDITARTRFAILKLLVLFFQTNGSEAGGTTRSSNRDLGQCHGDPPRRYRRPARELVMENKTSHTQGQHELVLRERRGRAVQRLRATPRAGLSSPRPS